MDSERWRRGAVSHGMLLLLALHAVNEYYRLPWKPSVTTGLLAANTLIYLRPSFLNSLLPFVDEVWFNAYLFSQEKEKKRKGKMKMASAQALPSSRTQEHLEVGKRQLEEFHKKKAAEKAKKATSTSQTNVSDVSLNEKQQLEYLIVNLNEKLCSIYLSKLITANENILEKKHDFYSTK